MSFEQSGIPSYVIEVGAVEQYLELEPPITEKEVSDLQYYFLEFGEDGVFAGLHSYALKRNTIIDPTYATIALSFSPGAIIFTDEELEALPPFTEEELAQMAEERRVRDEAGDLREQRWRKEGIYNPTMASQRVEVVRKAEGDEAAEIYYQYLWPKAESWGEEDEEKQQLISRRYAAQQQRDWQVLPEDEKLARLARHNVLLYRLATGRFHYEDDGYE